jgi:hypothetical protein
MWNKQGNIFNKHHAQLPVVDVHSDFYRIYYSTRIEGRSIPMFIDVDRNNPSIILKESSIPILELGKVGMFDHYGVMPTDIITLDNIKYLYYIGWSLRKDIPYHNTLGLAISKDNGNTWKKYSEGPIFNSNVLEPGFIGTAKVFKNNDQDWIMYYLSCREWVNNGNKLEPTYDIKIATSINGIEWIPTNKTAISLKDNEGGIASFQMIENQAWFSVRGKLYYRNNINESYKIKSATLIDNNWIRNIETSLDISLEGWDSEMVAYPYIIKENDKLIMFYNGNNFGKTGIGYAIK